MQTFYDDIDCILRIQVTDAPHNVSFLDLMVDQGDPILIYHLWNERLPELPLEGPNLAWSARLLRLFKKSLQLLALYIQESTNLPDIQAIAGVTVLLPIGRGEGRTNFMERLGFTTMTYQSPLGRFGEFWENFYTWGLMWTYNPVSLRGRSLFKLERKECWMNIQNFKKKYGNN